MHDHPIWLLAELQLFLYDTMRLAGFRLSSCNIQADNALSSCLNIVPGISKQSDAVMLPSLP